MRFSTTLAVFVCLCSPVTGQQPLDLFQDVPELDPEYIRLGSWNLRHINVEGQADDFLPGATEAEDFQILIATFAEAIDDVGLDIVAISEHQPRQNEANRLHQIRDQLNQGLPANTWRAAESNLPYQGNQGPFGGLQLALLWDSRRVTVDPAQAQALLDQRQTDRLRAPWLVPVTAGQLQFDLIVIHLKSGGEFPQADEVRALQTFINNHQSQPSPRHLIIVGDWNIRPDQSSGRNRLRTLKAGTDANPRMRILTVEEIAPDLDQWAAIGSLTNNPAAGLVPFTHFNLNTPDTFLDHIAISHTLDEIFDHPIQVGLAGSNDTDIRPGIRIALPNVPEANFHHLTDHLPVVLTLRTNVGMTAQPTAPISLEIVAAIPNPHGDDNQNELVRIRNTGSQPVSLEGWRIFDSRGTFWALTMADGTIQLGQTLDVIRNGRPMSLNQEGDTIILQAPDPGNQEHDRESYLGPAASGQVFVF